MGAAIITISALGASAASILSCWRAWEANGRATPLIAASTAFWALSVGCWIAGFGAEIGIPLALETTALIAFAFILTRMERRPVHAVRERAAPPLPRRNYWKGTARALVAGILGFAAAIGLGTLFATQAPLAEQTRLILAALAMPSLWCAAIAWTVCDKRLLPQSLTFIVLAVASGGITYLAG